MLTIKFFAVLRERLAVDQLQLDINKPISVAKLLEQLKSRSDKWHRELSRYDLLCAVNHEFAEPTQCVGNGDEVALFPPVTGG
ncbi:molybdopterin synthase sulfur carrier subunit [Idiomarina sp. OT37-5b]|jgi:molybdopterin synthase sulfur carrier subunit|uniref:MoaD/ThiS family protein n=1 Tax=Idiomarina sp. OT37-5b TaxID=2100422 RepID=UPI000CF98596|nr:MoaD/ThiS family protein [Idiomarina sp. OT37-5b]AVJ54908.1 molybdopterin synthase sulfur carrier subunit [Idiomarina sp. OT37-5b]